MCDELRGFRKTMAVVAPGRMAGEAGSLKQPGGPGTGAAPAALHTHTGRFRGLLRADQSHGFGPADHSAASVQDRRLARARAGLQSRLENTFALTLPTAADGTEWDGPQRGLPGGSLTRPGRVTLGNRATSIPTNRVSQRGGVRRAAPR